MAGGVLHYLVKPFTARVLMDRLDAYVEHRRHISGSGQAAVLDQDGIDRLLAPAGAPLATIPASRVSVALPKGLSQPTLEAVIADLNATGAASSASEVAGRLGLARVSARRYLEYLVSRGEARITPRYGAAGRPEKFYLLTGG